MAERGNIHEVFDVDLFYETLNKFRKEKGFNQTYAGKILEISAPRLSNMEWRKYKPSLEVYIRACLWMKVSLDTFIKK